MKQCCRNCKNYIPPSVIYKGTCRKYDYLPTRWNSGKDCRYYEQKE